MISADTNVFVYAHDERDALRRAVADAVLERLPSVGAWVGLQVVGELQNALRRRLRLPAAASLVAAERLLACYPTFAHDERAVARALTEAKAGRLSYWDALLLSGADAVGVRVMLSEGMADGLVFGGVEVINPFGRRGLSRRARQALGL